MYALSCASSTSHTHRQPLPPSVLLFARYGDHRDLHSFPTRRSSDLRWTATSTTRELYHRRCRFRREARGEHEQKEDRKSTRLNSSHGYISYAVLCLKKKNDQ